MTVSLAGTAGKGLALGLDPFVTPFDQKLPRKQRESGRATTDRDDGMHVCCEAKKAAD